MRERSMVLPFGIDHRREVRDRHSAARESDDRITIHTLAAIHVATVVTNIMIIWIDRQFC